MASSFPKRPSVCTHIKASGQRCGSPALRGEFFCYFHTRIIKGVQQRVDMRLHSMAVLEDCESIQLSLMHVVDGLVKGTLDPNRAKLIIQALRIAARNAKNVRFDDRLYKPTDPPMVREIPDYARQYQLENSSRCGAGAPAREAECSADTPVRESDPSPCSADTPVREAEATAVTQREALAAPFGSKKNNPLAATEPAAKRRNNAAHSASCGFKAKIDPAPKERKNHRDGHRTPPPAQNPNERELIKQAEAAITRAVEGDWSDISTLLELAGITKPSKEAPC